MTTTATLSTLEINGVTYAPVGSNSNTLPTRNRHVDTLATHLLEGMTQHIPDYSDWEDALKEFPERTLSEKDLDFFRLGWYAYSRKMWDMINDD